MKKKNENTKSVDNVEAFAPVNMKKRRQQMADIHTTLAIGSKVMFAGGIYGKVVRLGEEEIIGVEIAPKTIIDISRFAIQAIENK